MALAAASARAQSDPERARLLFQQGVAAMDRGSPAEAAGYFDQSYRLYPRASTACNMAIAQERLGRPCDAISWYRQCAALDPSLRDRANRDAAALAPRCGPGPVHDPFVRAPASPATVPAASGSVRVVDRVAPAPTPAYRVDHTLLGVGIGALVLGGGAFVGGVLSALEAQAQVAQLPPEGGPLVHGTPEADTYYRAATFRDVALGLYIGGGLLAGLGAILVIVDLAQPGALGGTGARFGPRFAVAPAPGGGFAQLALSF